MAGADDRPLRRRLLRFVARSAAKGLDRLEDTLLGPIPEADESDESPFGDEAPGPPTSPAAPTAAPSAVDAAHLAAGMPAGPATAVGAGFEGGEPLVKATQLPESVSGEPAGEASALYWDPFALVEQLGYKEKPTAITYGTLRAMVWKLPILRAIIKTRVDQVAAFCLPQMPPHEPGFRIRLRESTRTPQLYELKEMRRIEEWLMSTGVIMKDRREREGIELLVRKLVEDSLTFDQLNMEVVPDRRGLPCQWYAVDPATIRYVDSAKLAPDHNMDSPYCVQIYDNVVVGEFTRREMVFGVRNPRTDIRSHGYGTAEAEMMINTITYLLWGMQHNGTYFSQGSIPKGLLNIKGAIPDRQLRAFRRQWYQMVSGTETRWRTPIINAEDLEWLELDKTNRDMEFSAWMDFLIKIACSVYGMDPIEVNFKYGGSGQKAMFEAANKVKIVESKAKGLQPLLKFVARIFNENIIWPNTEDFALEFTGLSPMTPKELADLETMKVRTYMTVDEIRASHDLPPMPEGLGAIINDPNWMEARRELLVVQQEQGANAPAQTAEQAKQQEASSTPTRTDDAPPGSPASGGTAKSLARTIEITL